MPNGLSTIRRGVGFGPLSTITRGYLSAPIVRVIIKFCLRYLNIAETPETTLAIATALMNTMEVSMASAVISVAGLVDASIDVAIPAVDLMVADTANLSLLMEFC